MAIASRLRNLVLYVRACLSETGSVYCIHNQTTDSTTDRRDFFASSTSSDRWRHWRSPQPAALLGFMIGYISSYRFFW